MSLPSNTEHKNVLAQIKVDYPAISFIESERCWWDPEKLTVYYNLEQKDPLWSLLHEVGHMIAGHKIYHSDIELLKMESQAWEIAHDISPKYSHPINEEYIQDCLDSYRDWLHKRSTCPSCSQTGVQKSESLYMCLNCQATWNVSKSRFCRSYRKKQAPTLGPMPV